MARSSQRKASTSRSSIVRNRRPVAKLRLQRGRDFDQVILGIPVGALGAICKGLIDQKQGWADMVLKLETARTQSLQLWVDRATDDLGGPFVAPP